MKSRFVALTCVLLLTSVPAFSQTERGSWELSFGGNVGSYTVSSEYSSGSYSMSSESDALGYLGMDVRVGGYVLDGLSIEPEIYFLAIQKNPPMFNLGANLAYTFAVPESKVLPFLIAGYGVGNGVPMMKQLSGRLSDKLDIPVLRVGGGVKMFLSTQVALKAEYRYERYSHESSFASGPFSSTSTFTLNNHNLLLGFSVFFPTGE